MSDVARGESAVAAVHFGRRALSTLALADRALSAPWPSYVLILLLQGKVMWRIWELRDITYGDTSGYFKTALLWARGFNLNIVWSPLYTMFYGSFLFATSDPYNATMLHRIVIVFAAVIGVLFVLRQLLPPSLALLGAAWWAVLPINYNALYEVHLFALLPILLAWALVLGWDNLWTRGTAVAILATCALCLRNEFLIAAAVMASLYVVHAWRRPKRSVGSFAPIAVPLMIGAAICAFAYWRSIAKFPAILPHLQLKHALNMCQVFAFGYQQRHPDWTASPWTECQQLAHATFGVDYPSLGHMLWSNSAATLSHFLWNLSLVPNGLEVLLFNARAGNFNPDYVPTDQASYPLVLGALVLVVLAAGLILAWRDRPIGSLIFHRVTFAFLPLLVMAVPLVLTQRPRPSYFFYVSVIVIAATMAAFNRIVRHWPKGADALRVGALATVAFLILFMPTYSLPSYLPGGRPLMAKLEHLTAQRAWLVKPAARMILGDWASELVFYLDLRLSTKWTPHEGPPVVFDNELLRLWDGSKPLEQFLAEQQISILYLDPGELARLRAQPQARNLLDNPLAVGWTDLAHEERGEQSWALLRKR